MGTDAPTDAELLRIREQIADAVNDGLGLNITGGQSRAFYGQQIVGEPLSVAGYRGIVSYEPTELVVTVRAGTPVREVQEALAGNDQFMPFEPPVFGPSSTIGGMIASGLSGPRRAAVGAVRDFVLGASMIDASGQWLGFGGQVMKNVAGYDVSRLLCGSLGILGVIADVSLKVLPLPITEQTLALPMGEADAIRLVNELSGQPVPVSASCWHEQLLHLRLSGATVAVQDATRSLLSQHEGQAVPDAAATEFWQQICDQQFGFFDLGEHNALWRLSVPSTAPVIELPGQQLIEWGGALRWWRTDAPSHAIRAAAHAVGGNATLFRGGDKSVGVFDPLPEPLAQIHQRLKSQLDPRGVFNRGRMYPEL